MKLTQETISDLKHVKPELNRSVQRKEKESVAISARIDDVATLGSTYNKQVMEHHANLEKLDEELSIEHANRAKAEKSHSFLKIRRTLKILVPGLSKLVRTLPHKLNSTRSVKENLKRSTLPMKVPWQLSDKKHNNTKRNAELAEQLYCY